MKKQQLEKMIFLTCTIICLLVLIISGLQVKALEQNIEELNYINSRQAAQLKDKQEQIEVLEIIINNQEVRIREAAEPQARIYDIPLSEELQEFTYQLCKENNLDYELVLAMMDQESDYREDVISPTNDFGIMQINAVNHDWLSETLNIDDFLDAKQNIAAGLFMLKDLTTRYEDLHQVLMAYNHGEYGAQKKWEEGIFETTYSRGIIQRKNELKEE